MSDKSVFQILKDDATPKNILIILAFAALSIHWILAVVVSIIAVSVPKRHNDWF